MDSRAPIDTRLLRYFVAVADELSFSRAAERLHLSQPPLSYAIRQLEDSLGVQLFRRNSRNVELTAAGAALHREARFLLQRGTEVRELVQRIDAGLQGRVKMGIVGSMLYRGLPHVIARCRRLYPDVDITLAEMNSAEQIELVERGGLDVGFIHANPLPPGLESRPLLAEPFVLCVPAAHPLAGGRMAEAGDAQERHAAEARNAAAGVAQMPGGPGTAGLASMAGMAGMAAEPAEAREGPGAAGMVETAGVADLADLAGDDFVFFARSASPAYYQVLLALCQEAGFVPRIRYEVRHWLSVVSLVAQGMGVAIVPACMATSGLPNTAFLPFPHTPRSQTLFIWKRDNSSSIVRNCRDVVLGSYGG